MKAAHIAIAAATIAPVVLACVTADDDVNPVLPAVDGGADGSAQDAIVADVAVTPTAVSSPPTFLRIANWSPDSPAVDLCIAPHGTGGFLGPLIGALAASTDSGPSGVSFPIVSAYISVPPGQYDARIVVAGASDCAAGIGTDATSLPTLAASGFATFALVGEAHPSGGEAALKIAVFLDDSSSSAAVALRFVNASPELLEVDLGTGTLSAMNFTPLFQGVQFASASMPVLTDASGASIDKNGYETLSKLANVTLSAHLTGAATDSVATTVPVSAASGSILTIALVGGTSAALAALLECVDNAGTVGTLENCTLLP
jgi:hypothetical protein